MVIFCNQWQQWQFLLWDRISITGDLSNSSSILNQHCSNYRGSNLSVDQFYSKLLRIIHSGVQVRVYFFILSNNSLREYLFICLFLQKLAKVDSVCFSHPGGHYCSWCLSLWHPPYIETIFLFSSLDYKLI